MSLHRRKWSQKEKEEILLYADEHGVSKTSREYNVSTATIYNWSKCDAKTIKFQESIFLC